MALPTLNYDMTGNAITEDATILAYDSQTSAQLSPSSRPGVVVSSVSPPTFAAPKGTLCLSTAGSSTSTRMYVNTNGTTGWTAVTTAG